MNRLQQPDGVSMSSHSLSTAGIRGVHPCSRKTTSTILGIIRSDYFMLIILQDMLDHSGVTWQYVIEMKRWLDAFADCEITATISTEADSFALGFHRQGSRTAGQGQ